MPLWVTLCVVHLDDAVFSHLGDAPPHLGDRRLSPFCQRAVRDQRGSVTSRTEGPSFVQWKERRDWSEPERHASVGPTGPPEVEI